MEPKAPVKAELDIGVPEKAFQLERTATLELLVKYKLMSDEQRKKAY